MLSWLLKRKRLPNYSSQQENLASSIKSTTTSFAPFPVSLLMLTTWSTWPDFIVRDICTPTTSPFMLKNWLSFCAMRSTFILNSDPQDHSVLVWCMQVMIKWEDSNFITLIQVETTLLGKLTQLVRDVSQLSVLLRMNINLTAVWKKPLFSHFKYLENQWTLTPLLLINSRLLWWQKTLMETQFKEELKDKNFNLYLKREKFSKQLKKQESDYWLSAVK